MTVAQRFAAISRYFRRRRMERFAAELGLTAETRVLDIGGTPDNWQLLAAPPRLVLLNTPRAAEDLAGAPTWVAGDGRALPFRDAIRHQFALGVHAQRIRGAVENLVAGRLSLGHAVLCRLGLVFGLFSVAGAEAPATGFGDQIFVPIVSDGAIIHAQNVGTLQARFQITYEYGDAVQSGWIKPGSSWTFIASSAAGRNHS